MPTYYADFDLATGDNDGTSWANAWQTMARAIAGTGGTTPAAGDTVYCRGTDTLASGVTNTIVGTISTRVKWIGTNASGVNDGTRATLNCNGGTFSALTLNGALWNVYENFRFTGSGNAHGVRDGAGSTYYHTFINCSFDTNGGYGVAAGVAGGLTSSWYFLCTFYGNARAMEAYQNDQFYFCSFHDNTSYGLMNSYNSTVYGCINYDNGTYNCYQPDFQKIINCVYDGAAVGVDIWAQAGHFTTLIGCRITNATTAGLRENAGSSIIGWNMFDSNKDNYSGTSGFSINYNGADTNLYVNEDGAGGGDTEQGYVDQSAHDYSTGYVSLTDPKLRRTAITIPVS